MNRLVLEGAVIAVLCSSSALAEPTTQVPPPAPKAAHVEILQEPVLEFAREDMAIIRWTSNNPGGPDDHFAVVRYGTDPENLNWTARSHIRLNRDHPETLIRVRIDGLKPLTTYYYRVTSTEGGDASDGEKSAIEQFTTPGPGKRIVAFPQPK
ncbi:MAG: fibronectin type III domain-containing protein [Rhodomicrobium sp.]